MLPEMLAEPGAGHRPVRPAGRSTARADRCAGAPDIGIVVSGPAAAAVVELRCLPTVDAQLVDQIEERFVTLGQVARLCRPVVHLGVDVQRPVRAPGRTDLVVPDALEIGGLRPRPRAGDEEIAAVLEVEGDRKSKRPNSSNIPL